MFVIARCDSGGAAPSMSVRWRRMSTILSMCSIVTGHASTHAAQVVHAQSSSGLVDPVRRRRRRVTVRLRAIQLRAEQLRALAQQLVADVEHDLLRIERLA